MQLSLAFRCVSPALLPNDRAAWLPIEGSAGEDGPVVTAWDAIHRYFDAHREEMIRGYQQREAAKIEKERIARENPAIPKKTVISYWRKDGTTPRPERGALK